MFGITTVNRRKDLFAEMYDEMNRIFNEQNLLLRPFNDDLLMVEVRERDGEWRIDVRLPEVKREDIVLRYEDEYLVIEAKQDVENEVKREDYVQWERRTAIMKRRIYLPNVRSEEIMARFEEGVLQIVARKAERPVAEKEIIIQ
jgi:HSP20 family protein